MNTGSYIAGRFLEPALPRKQEKKSWPLFYRQKRLFRKNISRKKADEIDGKGGFTARVFNATGSQVEKSLSNIERQLEFYASEIAVINPPMIQFKTQQGEAHVDFELF